jgi:hypothetical protein
VTRTYAKCAAVGTFTQMRRALHVTMCTECVDGPLAMTRPAGGVSPDGARRPRWLRRLLTPSAAAFRLSAPVLQTSAVGRTHT